MPDKSISEITSLLNRLAVLEARVAALEARFHTTAVLSFPVGDRTPPPSTQTCPYCYLPLSMCHGHTTCYGTGALSNA